VNELERLHFVNPANAAPQKIQKQCNGSIGRLAMRPVTGVGQHTDATPETK